MKISGAQAVVKALELEGVDTVFGYPGGAILPVYDALLDSGIHHVLVRHEQSAAHAASGYARSTGRVGVCIATSGPGATNLATGIATAYMDSIAMVAITGQVPVAMIGRDVFQEVDTTGTTEPFTKHNYLVKKTEDIPRILKEAFYIARTGRPGPVLVDIPKDVAEGVLEFEYPKAARLRGYKPTYKGDPEQIDRMIREIKKSRRPVICVGGGGISSGASEEIRELAERIKAPVATTLMGIGSFPATHPLFLGMMGQHGVYAANRAVAEADLLIVLGARMGDRATRNGSSFAQEACVVHIDIDPAEIGKNISTHIPIVGDVKQVLTDVLKQDLDREDQGWLEMTAEWKRVYEGPGEGLEGVNPMKLMETLSNQLGKDFILVTDVGQHQIWAGRYLKIERPRAFLTSGGFGTMGYGLPAAIGAKIACPGKRVVLLTGDGSFQMNLMELATLVQEGLDIKMILLNNRSLGMVREIQQHSYRGRYYQVSMKGNPDFIKLAAAYGIHGLRIKGQEDLSQAIERVLTWEGPLLAEVEIDPRANVIPA